MRQAKGAETYKSCQAKRRVDFQASLDQLLQSSKDQEHWSASRIDAGTTPERAQPLFLMSDSVISMHGMEPGARSLLLDLAASMISNDWRLDLTSKKPSQLVNSY